MPYERSVSVSGGGDTVGWMSPMKMFEYMASGRLIIASDLPVLHKVLDDGNALFAAPGDVAVWARALDRAIADDALRARLGFQALEDVRRYTWRRRVSRCLDLAGGTSSGQEQ
jgi:glycosyltransferase involved in cell wall biosynthesis